MAAAAAEQIYQSLEAELQEPSVIIVPETLEDELVRHRAANFIGSVAVGATAAAPPEVLATRPIESLYEAIQRAAEGDTEARKLIEVNAQADVIERTMKSGHVMSVDLMVDENGKIQQHNQTMESVQANSLRYAANSWQMRERTEAETRNAFRIEELYRENKLEDYSFVVISRAADNMSEKDMKKAGFFTETMSCAIQVTSLKNGRLVTESAFVSGVKEPGGERYDEQAVIELAARHGVNLKGKTTAEIIDTPLLIHNSQLPNGAVDIVKVWDEVSGTFFGEAKPRQDYDAYRKVCEAREARFAPKVEKIVSQLISEARFINSPQAAVQRLHKISEEQMIEQAIGDDDIDPRVFGPAAADIRQARLAYFAGRPDEIIDHMERAKANAQSSSCPGGGSTETDSEESGTKSKKSSSSEDDCEFVSKECPICHTKNVKTKVTKSRITGACGCSKAK